MSGSAHRAGGNLAEGSIKYNERNRNVYPGKVCAQMYTMKTRGNEPTFSINERKCAATSESVYRYNITGKISCDLTKPVFRVSDYIHIQHKPGCTATEDG